MVTQAQRAKKEWPSDEAAGDIPSSGKASSKGGNDKPLTEEQRVDALYEQVRDQGMDLGV